jgi:hypothetical protein
MVFGADQDRAVSTEHDRQIKAEGSEEDFEHELAMLKMSHEKEISLLSDSLFAEQRRQQTRLRERLNMRKKKRKAEMESGGSSESDIDAAMKALDDEFEMEEVDLLRQCGSDIEKRIKVVRDNFSNEEKKAEDYHAILESLKNEHESR